MGNTCRTASGTWSDQTYAPSNVLWASSDNPDAWNPNPDQEDGGLLQEEFNIDEHPIDLELCFTIDGEEYTASTQTGHNVGLYGDGSIDYVDGSTTVLAAVLSLPNEDRGEVSSGTARNVLVFAAMVALMVGVLVAIMKHRSAVPEYDAIGCEPQQS